MEVEGIQAETAPSDLAIASPVVDTVRNSIEECCDDYMTLVRVFVQQAFVVVLIEHE
jgi:hypothetical protein